MKKLDIQMELEKNQTDISICMNIQNFEIREWTVRILGRLVPHNASQILPYLRQLIVSLISQLE